MIKLPKMSRRKMQEEGEVVILIAGKFSMGLRLLCDLLILIFECLTSKNYHCVVVTTISTFIRRCVYLCRVADNTV